MPAAGSSRSPPAGKELIDAAYTAHVAEEQRLLAGLDAQDRADLERILSGWLRRIEAERAPDAGSTEPE